MKLGKKRKRGFVLPTLVILTMVLLLLTGAVLDLGTVGLRTATLDQQTETAMYAAEAGLVQAAEEYTTNGEFTGTFKGTLEENDSSFEVELYTNDTPGPATLPNGVQIPEQTVYFRSVGISQNGTRKECGALFRKGLGSFQVGALANTLSAQGSQLDAYNSDNEAPGYSGPGFDPAAAQNNRAIVASNEGSGTVFDLQDTTVKGAVYVGPGGDPNAQITKSGNTVVASAGALTTPIEPEDVVVPTLPDGASGDGSGSGTTPGSIPPQVVTLANMTVNVRANGNIEFSNSCFLMTLQPNGNFTATENPGSPFAGGTLQTTGNIYDIQGGGAPTSTTGANKNGGTGFDISASTSSFKIAGSWHNFSIDSSGMITADNGPNGLVGNSSTGHLSTTTLSAPPWLTSVMTGGANENDAENPLDLEPGAYDEVNIDAIASRLSDEGTYMIKRLNITDGGALELPAGSDNVTIYVTESLSIEGENAIVNTSRKAPNLKIYYTGTDPVKVAGGSQAFFTLLAEDADVTLEGPNATPSEFYGALVGRTVTINNANFHYDVATAGIGTGTDSSTLTLLSRHR